jgi:hypothetical protein
MYDWEDPEVYRWQLTSNEESDEYTGAVGGFIVGTLMPIFLCLGLWLVGLVSAALAHWTAVGFAVLFVPVLVSDLWGMFRGDRLRRLRASQEVVYAGMLLLGCLLYLCFSPLSTVKHHFENGADAGLWQWLLFYIDNINSAVFFDVFDIYEIQFSSVAPHDDSSRLLTLFLRLLITVGVVWLVTQAAQAFRSKSDLDGTVRECWWHCEGLMRRPEHFRVHRVGRMVPLTEPPVYDVPELIASFVFVADAKPEEEQEAPQENADEE